MTERGRAGFPDGEEGEEEGVAVHFVFLMFGQLEVKEVRVEELERVVR